MSRWFRWYAGTTEDGKFRMVARVTGVTVATVTGVWAALLEDASHPDHRGVVTKNEDYFAAVLDLDDDTMDAILAAMQDSGMLSIGHGAMTVVHWKERQYETDGKDATNAERQRRYRAKRQENGSQTIDNGSNALRKRPESEADTETDTRPVQSTEQEPAREASAPKKAEQILDIESKVKLGAKALPSFKPTAIDRLKVQAEKFGLDADDIAEKTAKRNATNPAGYFISLSVNQLQSRLPFMAEKVLTAAMRGESLAVSTVYQALSEPAQ